MLKFFKSKVEAKNYMKENGLVLNKSSYGREYYIRTDGQKDRFLDHSATLEKAGKQMFAVCDYTKE